jgi:ferric-dicitrate binding protein FerR (iron transport regulator)
LKTARGSEADITLRDGSVIVVTEDSEITMSRFVLGESRYTSIGLLVGRVKMTVGKLQKGGEFNVNTIVVTAAVRGTVFGASVREDGAVLIDVEYGLVEVDNAGGADIPGGTGAPEKAGGADELEGAGASGGTEETGAPGKADKIGEAGGFSETGVHGKTGAPDGSEIRREIPEGEAVAFYISGRQEAFRGSIDPGAWRAKAQQTIRDNPEIVVRTLLERERRIIESLKRLQSEADEHRREWDEFVKRVQYLERRGLYEQEKMLIGEAIRKTRRGLIFIMRVRRNLTVVRSILVIAARIELSVGPDRAKVLPSIGEIRKEYAKIGFTISRLGDTESKLRRVLAVLNETYRRFE